MSKHRIYPNMPGRNRPQLTCDNLGYSPEVGDYEWEIKLRKLYVRVPGGWRRRCYCRTRSNFVALPISR